jgi:serine phosphatase RsbU (regulator of sigma subunit)/Flp pilus assembly protein TadD
MKFYKIIAIMTLFLIISNQKVYSQVNKLPNDRESLKKMLKTDLEDSIRTDILTQLTQIYSNSDLDSALFFGMKALDLAEKKNDRQRILKSRQQIGLIYHNQSRYNKAREYFKRNFDLANSYGDSLNIGKALKNIGATHANENNKDEAINNYLSALKIFESIGNQDGMAVLYGVLGNLYLRNADYDQALNHYDQAGELFRRMGSEQYLATVIMNKGIVYKNMGEYEKAKESYSRAGDLFKKLGNKIGEAHCSGNLAILSLRTGEYEKSIQYNNLAYNYYHKNGMRKNAVITLIDIGRAYDSLERKDKSIAYYHLAYSKTDTSELISLRVELNNILHRYYKNEGDYKKALDYHKKYVDQSFKLFEKENKSKMDEVLTKYETEQKEKRIALLEKQSKIDKIMNISGFGLFFSFLLISGVLFHSYRRKKKDNELLEEQNQQITQQKEEIFSQNEILQQQKEEISSQRDELASKGNILSQQKQALENVHLELKKSIQYAKSIQGATLPSEKMLKKILPEHFIFFQPQNIVGGDFYWAVQANGKTYIAAADCTGHGVPGGFMSMLGMTFLDEIVVREGIQDVHHILDRLRELVIDSLHQKNTIGSVKDGMYIGICAIDYQNKLFEFAGANTPVFIIEKNSPGIPAPENAITNDTIVLKEIRPDHMPVSIHPKMRNFNKQVIPLDRIQSFYMTSDGYTDQFGGDSYKKYGKKGFKELLLSIGDKPMAQQLSVIVENFEQWKGDNNQIDDVMVVGVRLNGLNQ